MGTKEVIDTLESIRAEIRDLEKSYEVVEDDCIHWLDHEIKVRRTYFNAFLTLLPTPDLIRYSTFLIK